MSTVPPMQDDYIRRVIEHHLKDMVEREFDGAMKNIVEFIEKRKGEIVAGVMVDMMKQVDFATREDRVIITIRKP